MGNKITIFRCRYSKLYTDNFSYRLCNQNRIGSVVGYQKPNPSVVYVLWDGRKTIDSLSILYIDFIEDQIELNELKCSGELKTTDKLRLLNEASIVMQAAAPVTVKEPTAPKEKKVIILKPIKVKEPRQPKEPKIKKRSIFDQPQSKVVDMNKVSKFAGRAIYDPNSRLNDTPRVPIPEKEDKPFVRPPAIYDNNNKSLYGIDYNDL